MTIFSKFTIHPVLHSSTPGMYISLPILLHSIDQGEIQCHSVAKSVSIQQFVLLPEREKLRLSAKAYNLDVAGAQEC